MTIENFGKQKERKSRKIFREMSALKADLAQTIAAQGLGEVQKSCGKNAELLAQK